MNIRTCILTKAFFTSAFLLLFTLPAQAQAMENYQFDSSHTYALWRVNHFGYSNLSGKLMAAGTLSLDATQLQNSKVNVTVNTTSLVTGIPELDDVLKGRNFFDIQQYPTATFISDKIEKTGKSTAKLYGTLTLHGITKPVVLNVKINQMGIHPYYHKKAIGFSATAMLKRSDFGMGAYTPGVGDEVALDIEAEAETVAAAAPTTPTTSTPTVPALNAAT